MLAGASKVLNEKNRLQLCDRDTYLLQRFLVIEDDRVRLNAETPHVSFHQPAVLNLVTIFFPSPFPIQPPEERYFIVKD